MLEDFLIREGAVHLLAQRKKPLTEMSRRELIRHAGEFMVSKFGSLPTANQKEAMASAIVFLFPSLKSIRSKTGTVSYHWLYLVI